MKLKKQEDERLQRLETQTKQLEEQRQQEEDRLRQLRKEKLAAEKAAREAEIQRKKVAEKKRQAEEAQRVALEKAKAAEAEEKRKQAEKRRAEERAKAAQAEKEKLLAEKKRAEAEAKKAKEAAEQARLERLEAERQAREAKRKAEEAKRLKAEQEAALGDLFSGLTDESENRRSARGQQILDESQKWAGRYVNLIQSSWIVDDSLFNLNCRLKLQLAADGLVYNVETISGSEVLCRSAKASVFKIGQFPMPSDPDVANKLRNIHLNFEL